MPFQFGHTLTQNSFHLTINPILVILRQSRIRLLDGATRNAIAKFGRLAGTETAIDVNDMAIP
jgi:hypothetical protein